MPWYAKPQLSRRPRPAVDVNRLSMMMLIHKFKLWWMTFLRWISQSYLYKVGQTNASETVLLPYMERYSIQWFIYYRFPIIYTLLLHIYGRERNSLININYKDNIRVLVSILAICVNQRLKKVFEIISIICKIHRTFLFTDFEEFGTIKCPNVIIFMTHRYVGTFMNF